MITIKFFCQKGNINGFEANGHAMAAPYGEDIICAAVSSACLMAANTITEVAGVDADASSKSGNIVFHLKDNSSSVQDILKGLELHLKGLPLNIPKT